ncbi:MAG: FkbM family methyltransferase [Selenomonadaceae bacterium]|nr:FkbM family methyltransferase [Selenomonadaceae bacterium]
MERVALFGIGNNYSEVKDEIAKKYNVVALFDNKTKNRFPGGVQSPEDVVKTEYDKIFILPYSTKCRREMYFQLRDYGVDGEKIFPYYSERLFPKEHIRNQCKLEFSVDGYIYAQIDDVRVKVCTESDEWVLREIFFGEEYGFDFGKEELTVIDIGMNVGMASLFFARRSEVKAVYAFEPFPETYELGKFNIDLNRPGIGDKIHMHNYGLFDQEMEQSFAYNSDTPGGGKIADSAERLTEDNGGVTIKTKVASSVIEDIMSKHPDSRFLMKIDCEGSEYPIFENLDKDNTLDKFDYIIAETHSGCSRNVKDIERYLQKNGFIFFSTHYTNAIYHIKAIKRK